MKKWIWLSLLVCVLFSCTKDEQESFAGKIRISGQTELLLVGDSITLTLSGGSTESYTATTPNPDVVGLRLQGNQLRVEGIKEGRAQITVSSGLHSKNITLRVIASVGKSPSDNP